MIQRTSGPPLGFLVSIINQFRNELKGNLKAFLLEFKEKKIPGWASYKSSVGAEKGRKKSHHGSQTHTKQPHGREGNFRKRVRKSKVLGNHIYVLDHTQKKEKEKKVEKLYLSNSGLRKVGKLVKLHGSL